MLSKPSVNIPLLKTNNVEDLILI